MTELHTTNAETKRWMVSRRRLFGKVGAVGLGAVASVLAGPGQAEATGSAGCCTLAYTTHASWNSFSFDCPCLDMYVWNCCYGGTKYLCGECYCKHYSAHTTSGSC